MAKGDLFRDWHPDWIKPLNFYMARVTLGGEDHADVCPLTQGAAEKAMDVLLDLYGSLVEAGPDANESAVLDQLRSRLTSENREKVWVAVEAIIASSLVAWHVPELADFPAFGGVAPPAPNEQLVPEERQRILSALPLPVIVRIVVGALWQLKNSLGGSRPPAPA